MLFDEAAVGVVDESDAAEAVFAGIEEADLRRQPSLIVRGFDDGGAWSGVTGVGALDGVAEKDAVPGGQFRRNASHCDVSPSKLRGWDIGQRSACVVELADRGEMPFDHLTGGLAAFGSAGGRPLVDRVFGEVGSHRTSKASFLAIGHDASFVFPL